VAKLIIINNNNNSLESRTCTSVTENWYIQSIAVLSIKTESIPRVSLGMLSVYVLVGSFLTCLRLVCVINPSLCNMPSAVLVVINKAHRITVKQVVNDEFMKQIRTVRHSFTLEARQITVSN